ncbi:MAG: hypothetical protein QOC96_1275 [Acidobacteriota bacterium]|jgi:hypothetical protein|nr:hypothetical protein [Acidobacteriota bacterium]
MKKLFSSLIPTILVLSIFNAGQASSGLNAPSALPAAQQRGATIRFAPRQIRETNRRKRQTIKARYPQAIDTASDPRITKLNQELRSFIDKEVGKFRTDAQPPEQRTFSTGSTFDSKYNVEYAANGLVSIAFLIEAYYEGAVHGSYNTIVFNYDLTSGKMLRLSDLFKPNSNYLKPISDYAIASLKKELTPDPDFDWIKSGAGPEEKNYQSWNITRGGLQVHFDPYQVASYAEGPHEAVIPYSVLKNVINPDGPLAKVAGGR